MTFDRLFDHRVGCWSVLTTIPVKDLIEIVNSAYENRGGISFQRDRLKTTSGRRIRERMVADISAGAILPPLVIGIVIDGDELSSISNSTNDDGLLDSIRTSWAESISIIDGMQRTSALLDAVALNPDVKEHPVRVDFWLAPSADSLIYRMLVLNTGQTPWTLKRQLEVVFDPLVKSIVNKVALTRLLTTENEGRRTRAGEYSAADLVEAYLAFGIRRTEVSTQEALAEEFSRLDLIESLSRKFYDKYFYNIIETMVLIDHQFSRFDSINPEEDDSGKFCIGRNVFDSQPARIGFVVASAVEVLGRLGMERDEATMEAKMLRFLERSRVFLEKLSIMSGAEVGEFLNLSILGQLVGGQRRAAVGRYERAFFESAFRALIEEEFNVSSMEVCWRAG